MEPFEKISIFASMSWPLRSLRSGSGSKTACRSAGVPLRDLHKSLVNRFPSWIMQVGKHTLRETEEAIIEETLRLADYNKSLAAKQLGLTRFSLDRRLKKLANS